MSYDQVPFSASNPHFPTYDDEPLQPPPGLLGGPASARNSFSNLSNDSGHPIAHAGAMPYRDDPGSGASSALFADKEGSYNYNVTAYPPTGSPPSDLQANQKKKSRKPLVLGLIAVLLIIIGVVVVIVVVKATKKSSSSGGSSSSASSSGGSGTGTPTPGTSTNSTGIVYGAITTGGAGSTVTTEDGTTFTYTNTFGGIWVADPKDPYNSNAYAQSWSPPLNTTWDFEKDSIRGVNLGGWLVPEPFIVPALYEKYQNISTPAIDEWTLSLAMAADTSSTGGISQLENHYKTFITEQDFAQIAAAGLNWVRLPIPFWAIQKYDEEPFLEGVAWTYVLKALAWARKYGLRVNLDLHTMPGSQNGYNHSGKFGQVDFLNGVMGIANAQRGLEYMRILVEFITQPEFANLIPYFGVMNEAAVAVMGMDVMGSFYLHMHDVLRNITGMGTGHGPYLSIHDGFQALNTWADFLPGRDRMAMDTHPYLAFADQDTSPLSTQLTKPCSAWGASVNASWSSFGVTTAGEWSLAINDCGLWVNGVNEGTRWEGTYPGYTGPTSNIPCSTWNDWASWNETTKQDLQQFAMATMDALQNWFFWTWKVGNSSISGTVEAPFWSYQLGLQEGWMPTDPRAAVGVCGGASPRTPLSAEMTGGAGAGDFAQSVRDANPWPPTTLAPGNSATALPTYTATGTVPTLAMPVFTSASVTVTDNGWFDSSDNAPMYTPVAGCTYPDPWDAISASIPQPCTGTPAARRMARNLVAAPALPRQTAAP
ncbi:hypothetical protein FRB96_002639 [Tulasnella sp. 330]|nr:hypothetical protein FRB96_002639 [Tulasnella sp. 330]KAG8882867.1 hypothetical protein FRB98_003418 [Tulasnella sp. 332]KAG8882880.1 hypothetical protein FRB97_007599 [Tulasnella sp. 331]